VRDAPHRRKFSKPACILIVLVLVLLLGKSLEIKRMSKITIKRFAK
jgi:hypothetical protein